VQAPRISMVGTPYRRNLCRTGTSIGALKLEFLVRSLKPSSQVVENVINAIDELRALCLGQGSAIFVLLVTGAKGTTPPSRFATNRRTLVK